MQHATYTLLERSPPLAVQLREGGAVKGTVASMETNQDTFALTIGKVRISALAAHSFLNLRHSMRRTLILCTGNPHRHCCEPLRYRLLHRTAFATRTLPRLEQAHTALGYLTCTRIE